MKPRTFASLAGAAGLLLSASAFAQPGVVCGTASIAPGGSGTLSCNYLGTGSGAVGFQFDIGIGNADVTIDSITCAAGVTCPGTPADPFTAAQFSATLTEIADVTDVVVLGLSVAGTATDGAMIPVTVSGEVYSDAALGTITPAGTTNGTITVSSGPTLNSSGPVDVGNVEVGMTGTANFTLTAVDGTIGSIACTTSGAPEITVSAAPASIAVGSPATLTASCAPTAVGALAATHSCTSDASNSPTTTAISCTGAVGIAQPNPAGGTMQTINIGPVVRGSAGSGSLTISNGANNGSMFDVACTITDDGMGAFTAAGATSATGIMFGNPFTFAVNGQSNNTDTQPTGTATCTYSNGATGVVTIALGIALVPEIVPTMTQWGLILMTLVLIGFGAFQLRRRDNVA
ncbi:MAG: IPTL-CTERM sorting domain-containing protein [Pseudomonadota bacterium]